MTRNVFEQFHSPCAFSFSVFLPQQKIRQMHYLNSVDVSIGQFIQRHHIFGIVVFDFQQIRDLLCHMFYPLWCKKA